VRKASVRPEEIEDFVRQAEEALRSTGRSHNGPPVAVLRERAAPTASAPDAPGAVFEVEVRLPVVEGTAPPTGFTTLEVPAMSVAYTVHHGAAQGLPGAEEVLEGWVKMKALKAVRHVHRVYIKRGKNPRKHVTEVQLELER
jgi:hypothetical protein